MKARRALSALRARAVPSAHVVRDGADALIPAAELVPGDVVLLAAGARVPAGGRVIEAVRLRIGEATLTGESLPVDKTPDPVPDPEAALGDRTSMAFLGTVVTDGRWLLVVTATGPRAEVGRIGRLVADVQDQESPLERKLAQLGHALVAVVLGLTAVITLAGWARGHDFLSMVEVGIALAIAAVPEGQPAVATMTLALGIQRMARMRALVRRLPAVETLGSTTVICSDKTGTLTRNEMTARAYRLAGRPFEVTGEGYEPHGGFREAG
jgi:Ca2+-transporting ATPase